MRMVKLVIPTSILDGDKVLPSSERRSGSHGVALGMVWRSTERVLLLCAFFFCAVPQPLHAEPYARPDSFFEKGYLNKEREISAGEEQDRSRKTESSSAEDSFQKAPDSWEAPRANLPGSDVAGSDRVRDYRDGTGRFSSASSSSQAYAIPGSNSKAIALPGVGVLVVPGTGEEP